MHNKSLKQSPISAFELDTYEWFSLKRHAHMEKWQYLEPQKFGDPVRGNILWDMWEMISGKDNMLSLQGKIIKNNIHDMVALCQNCKTIVDFGPGGKNAVTSNTLPFIREYSRSIKNYIAIDISANAANIATNTVSKFNSDINCYALNFDFYNPLLKIPSDKPVVALMMGGTIGNFEAEQNTPNTISLMANNISKIKANLPKGSVFFIGLEATQDENTLYNSYDHPAHKEFEINLMHGIKRDVLSNESGFNGYAWKYSMKWWADAYQFCHIAEATDDQEFTLMGEIFSIKRCDQFVIDNSFKLPLIAMQKAVQLSNSEYLGAFLDKNKKMAIHAVRF